MFTGIITDIGKVRSVTRSAGGEWGDTRMEVACSYDVNDIDIGASINHAGACMTVVEKGDNWYAFDVSDESLSKTTMESWREGAEVNLERAVRAGDELGGHMVSGHVDGVGIVRARTQIGGSLNLQFSAPEDLKFALASKGSVTIDGVSLTVNNVGEHFFEVNIIPHTAEVTTLGKLIEGDKVNLEIDVMARYVARYLTHMKDKL